MAVINKHKQKEKSSLQALTAAALLLPGMLPATAEAIEEAEFGFQYGHYEEGERKVSSIIDPLSGSVKIDVPQTIKPIEVDSFLSSIKVALTDRITFKANFSQDTWAGASPVASAPAIFGSNDVSKFVRNGVVTGASPVVSAPSAAFLLFDKQLNPLGYNIDPVTFSLSTIKGKNDNEIAHTIAEASPETRKQGDFSLSYDWDNASVNVGGGISVERDYESRFYNFGGRLDFNQKLTSVDTGVSYTNSATNALVDHHSQPYFFNTAGDISDEIKVIAKKNGYSIKEDVGQGSKVIQGRRQDWGFNLGLTQIINKNALIKLSGSYTYSNGYMSNPYKGVTAFFITGPSALFGPNVLDATSFTYLEQRPLQRNQFNWNARLVQHIEPLDASVHIGYQFSHDDWGINTHTFDADWVQSIGYGWSITPRIRYYSQSEADFYTPYLVIPQNKSLPNYFSSDHRLSGFGTLSGGVTIKKEFAKGVSFVAGFEYYTHQGKLKLGGDGEGSYADFDSYMVNGAINVNMAALGRGMGGTRHHHGEHSAPLPAGVRLGHMLKSNEFMVGYRYQYNHTQGDLLHGRSAVSDSQVVANGCKKDPCFVAPNEMTMKMHMIDLMYAPTDWLTLMLMPQFVDKSMTMKELEGAPPHSSETGTPLGIAISHTRHEHITGGLGDTGMYAMFKLFDNSLHHLHLSLGFTAPTGDSDIKLRGAHGFEMGFIHYGMQVGSGTWDFKPSLTYTGQFDKWNWGAQVSGTKRLGKNDSGFSFGDELEGTAWGGYRLTDWLNATVRGVYSTKGKLRGVYTADGVLANPSTEPDNVAHVKVGTMDYPGNYGGRYWDVGFGLNAFVSKGDFRGNTFSFEWLQPVVDDVNGYQREREGALTASWSYMF